MDLQTVKKEIQNGIRNCRERGLYQTVKWLSELNYCLSNVTIPKEDSLSVEEPFDELDAYLLAKSYFDVKEYDRSAYFVRNCASPKALFLHYYARFLSIEKKRIDNMTVTTCTPDPRRDDTLMNLRTELEENYALDKLDGYMLYLYGVILKKLNLVNSSVKVLTKAVAMEPLLWSCWYELGKIVSENTFETASLPNHWMQEFYNTHVCLELLKSKEALQICQNLSGKGFENSTYLLSQVAMGYHNLRELDLAIETFNKIMQLDPYRLDNLDTYSNLLYVREMKIELAGLAHKVVEIDKYRVESCCVIGNYYSLRTDHQKAILYFRRALKLNPNFLSAWTLMGHEFMEMKNSNLAVHSYRQALEINQRDYRAWYGLGQAYEIMKLYFYSLYYYKQAQTLKPNDSRMLIALGDVYEKLDKVENAIKCYFKACNVGDIEGIALVRLAKLYDRLGETDSAAAAYTEYCLNEENKEKAYDDHIEFYNSLQYLANYYLNKNMLEDAFTYAYKCLESDETKENAKSLLRMISVKRGEQNIRSQMEDEPETPEQGDASGSDMNFSDMIVDNS